MIKLTNNWVKQKNPQYKKTNGTQTELDFKANVKKKMLDSDSAGQMLLELSYRTGDPKH